MTNCSKKLIMSKSKTLKSNDLEIEILDLLSAIRIIRSIRNLLLKLNRENEIGMRRLTKDLTLIQLHGSLFPEKIFYRIPCGQ